MNGTWAKVIADVQDRAVRGWIDPAEAVRLIRDMEDRDQIGRERYSVALAPFNGRDQLQDAFEEGLDLSAYLRALVDEIDEIGGSEEFRRMIRMTYEDSLAIVQRLGQARLLRERNPR